MITSRDELGWLSFDVRLEMEEGISLGLKRSKYLFTASWSSTVLNPFDSVLRLA